MNINAHHKGRRVRSLDGIRGLGITPGWPGYGAPDEDQYRRSLEPGWVGTIEDVESHGYAPYTRYAVRFDNGVYMSGIDPANVEWIKTCEETLAEHYAAELNSLRRQGHSPEIVTTSDGRTVLQATMGSLKMLATNGDRRLIEPGQTEDPDDAALTWSVAIYYRDNSRGNAQLAEGKAAELDTALHAALVSYHRRGVVD